MTAATVHWSPTLHPFDATIETKILGFANDMAVQADTASTEEIQGQVQASALAFADLSTAMADHDRAHVDTAIDQTKVEYAGLKQVCDF